MQGKLFVVSGPSGVGKDTIIENVLKEEKNLWLSISVTTREKRGNEVDGKDYYFVTEDEFKKRIKEDNLLEYVEVYKGLYYGTPKDTVLEKLKSSFNVVLIIDVKGALKIKEKFPEATLIMIVPPTIEILEERLKKRATDSQEKQKERLERARLELSYQDKFDYIVVNDEVADATKRVLEIIRK